MRSALARPFARGIDTVIALHADVCSDLRAAGIDFVVRYLHGRYAATRAEVDTILRSGLALMLVTPSRKAGWVPTRAMGHADGATAIEALTALDYPRGATVWLDLEGCAGPARETTAWVDAWSSAVVASGWGAGLYVGADPGGIDDVGLWRLPRVNRYWRSGSRVSEPANRGWCMQQLRPLQARLAGIDVDHNVIETDFRGGLPAWVVGP